jgi:transposase
MRKKSPQVTYDAISLLRQGYSYSHVAKRLSMSTSMVHKIKKAHLPGLSGARAGHPASLSEQDKRQMVRQITSGKFDTATEVHKDLMEHQQELPSVKTVRRALRSSGLKAAAKVKKPALRHGHHRARLEFAHKYKEWTIDDWKRVIWSDETKINCWGSDGRLWCWKKPGSGLQPHHVQSTVKHGGGSIMIWGCMTSLGPGSMAKIDGGLDAELYCKILDEDLLDTISNYGLDKSEIIFQHDNDPKHTAKKTKKWLEKQEMQVLDWPPQSPDLNPIEHLWDNLKRRLAGYENHPTATWQLWERVEAEWTKIGEEECMRLIESMPRRIAAVLKAKGGPTKY